MTYLKVVYIGEESKWKSLKKGKIYTASYDEMDPGSGSSGLYYRIINDKGFEQSYHSVDFISLENWRHKNLNEILSEEL